MNELTIRKLDYEQMGEIIHFLTSRKYICMNCVEKVASDKTETINCCFPF